LLIEFWFAKLPERSRKSLKRGVRVELNLDAVAVTHNEAAHRFEATVDGLTSLITYRRFPDRLVLEHTKVPQPLQGQGLAAKLTRTALDFARTNHLHVVSLCPYVSSFLRRHREYQDLLSGDDLQRLLSRGN
jgi:predicted GNAT family acetyltransferase